MLRKSALAKLSKTYVLHFLDPFLLLSIPVSVYYNYFQTGLQLYSN